MDVDSIRNSLRAMIGDMPLARVLRGEESMPTVNSLKERLTAMPVFDQQSGAQGAYDAAMNIGPMGLGKIVYHGSPHKFDKFDASKIGTGEGAQAYGHGVYLADAEGVAKGYAESLGKPIRTIDGNPKRAGNLRDELSDLVGNFGPDVARSQLQNALDSSVKYSGAKGKQYQDGLRKQMQMLDANDYGQAANSHTGALYKADLPDEWIPKMLDWDKPLSQQSKDVQEAVRKARELAGRNNEYWQPGRIVGGKHDYGILGDKVKAAEFLREAGIPGIRYLDGGSRGNGQGSYNYVVFPGLEDQVKILERNGQPVNALAEMLK